MTDDETKKMIEGATTYCLFHEHYVHKADVEKLLKEYRDKTWEEANVHLNAHKQTIGKLELDLCRANERANKADAWIKELEDRARNAEVRVKELEAENKRCHDATGALAHVIVEKGQLVTQIGIKERECARSNARIAELEDENIRLLNTNGELSDKIEKTTVRAHKAEARVKELEESLRDAGNSLMKAGQALVKEWNRDLANAQWPVRARWVKIEDRLPDIEYLTFIRRVENPSETITAISNLVHVVSTTPKRWYGWEWLEFQEGGEQ